MISDQIRTQELGIKSIKCTFYVGKKWPSSTNSQKSPDSITHWLIQVPSIGNVQMFLEYTYKHIYIHCISRHMMLMHTCGLQYVTCVLCHMMLMHTSILQCAMSRDPDAHV